MASASTSSELSQQHQELLEVEQLLQDSPHDESLLQLKADLLELIAVTQATVKSTEKSTENSNASLEEVVAHQGTTSIDTPNNDEEQISGWTTLETGVGKRNLEDKSEETQQVPFDLRTSDPPVNVDDRPQKKKKLSSSPAKEFQIPVHLQPNEKDSKSEMNRKKRAVKALKNQWRTHRKEHEANKKQKSWQDFQKRGKSGTSTGSSMFSTSNDGHTKVGVVGGRSMTDFASRKRHK